MWLIFSSDECINDVGLYGAMHLDVNKGNSGRGI